MRGQSQHPPRTHPFSKRPFGLGISIESGIHVLLPGPNRSCRALCNTTNESQLLHCQSLLLKQTGPDAVKIKREATQTRAEAKINQQALHFQSQAPRPIALTADTWPNAGLHWFATWFPNSVVANPSSTCTHPWIDNRLLNGVPCLPTRNADYIGVLLVK